MQPADEGTRCFLWDMSDNILQAACNTNIGANQSFLIEHARLKDHVSTMNGGLEAKIQEGFVTPFPYHKLNPFP